MIRARGRSRRRQAVLSETFARDTDLAASAVDSDLELIGFSYVMTSIRNSNQH
jgi:hypothetical protein